MPSYTEHNPRQTFFVEGVTPAQYTRLRRSIHDLPGVRECIIPPGEDRKDCALLQVEYLITPRNRGIDDTIAKIEKLIEEVVDNDSSSVISTE